MVHTSPAFVSVKFDLIGRTHHFLLPEAGFDPPLEVGEDVVVTQGNQPACATVVRSVLPVERERQRSVPPSQRALRRSSTGDVTRRLKHRHREDEAFQIAILKIKEHGLPMKLVRVEQLFDESRLVFSFTADGRVDFRELVRELAAECRCRIELRQIGPRDEARILGGYGTCGRPLCCTTWLTGFEPISIKMAKRQNLSLTPSRLSGLCGRLKCCLRYELPNAAGEQFSGCANESSCGRAGGCGSDTACGGSCGSCGNH